MWFLDYLSKGFMINLEEKMNKELKIAFVALIVQVMEFIFGVIGVINSINVLSIIFLCLIVGTTVVLIVLGYRLYSKVMYINFLEYLMHNDNHSFVLLPKIRMYLHSRKINNNIKIKKLNVTYDFEKNIEKPEEAIGDMTIIYSMEIENKNIPEQFDFVHGNDFSNISPRVKYSYGTKSDLQTMADNQNIRIAPYWRGALKHYNFAFEKQYLPQEGDIKIEIKVECEKAVDFMKVPRDTIICLPLAFSKFIDTINFTINVGGFGETKFFCDAYQISKINSKFSRKSINCASRKTSNNTYSFDSNVYPNIIKGEKAFYFRLGFCETDKEITS